MNFKCPKCGNIIKRDGRLKENRIKFVESFCRKFGVIVKLVKEKK